MSEEDWFAKADRIGRREGYFARLGLDHAALFADREPTLLVTFETVSAARTHPEGLPLAFDLCAERDWSHLSLFCRQNDWFRAPEVYAFFDRLVDEAFFDDFDRVVFFGAGLAGYAAAAYSVCAPGATVILVQPQATLEPGVTGWDPRFSDKRRLDFTSRYGFAPEMTEGADQVFVIFDPDQTYDAMHAALFRRPFTRFLPCRHLGGDVMGMLQETHMLPSILTSAGTGTFDTQMFWTYYRARRRFTPYLRRILGKLETEGRTRLAAMLAGNVGNRLNDERFRARARDLAATFRHGRTP